MVTTNDVLEALQGVKDPEIPTISVVDMGIITNVAVNEDGVVVTMTPTFVGCPAIDVMRSDVKAAVEAMGVANVTVNVTFDVPWTTNRVTERGKQALLKHGLAPPQAYDVELELTVLDHVACPYCGSTNTELRSPFGPTLCRSLHYCHACHQAFEGFKPV